MLCCEFFAMFAVTGSMMGKVQRNCFMRNSQAVGPGEQLFARHRAGAVARPEPAPVAGTVAVPGWAVRWPAPAADPGRRCLLPCCSCT